MSEQIWQGSGASYTITWGEESWTLQLDAERPGLRPATRPEEHALAMGALSVAGRCDAGAIGGRSLVRVERVGQRIEATYIPCDWSRLELRAAWAPASNGREGIDLEVQVVTSSIGELIGLEVFVETSLSGAADAPAGSLLLWVRPRDARSAGLSYDGRTPPDELARLHTLPPLRPGEPGFEQVVMQGRHAGSTYRYLELVHPHDVARRICVAPPGHAESAELPLQVRYGLFGHELEKGVVLRGRVRGCWFPANHAARQSAGALADFLSRPLPLGP